MVTIAIYMGPKPAIEKILQEKKSKWGIFPQTICVSVGFGVIFLLLSGGFHSPWAILRVHDDKDNRCFSKKQPVVMVAFAQGLGQSHGEKNSKGIYFR